MLKEDMRMSPPSLRSVGYIPASLTRPARQMDPPLMWACLRALDAQETGVSVPGGLPDVWPLSLFSSLYELLRRRDKELRYGDQEDRFNSYGGL